MTLHEFLDRNYGADGDAVLRRMLDDGAELNERAGPQVEAPLHVATRRRRASAIKPLKLTITLGACNLRHSVSLLRVELLELSENRRRPKTLAVELAVGGRW